MDRAGHAHGGRRARRRISRSAHRHSRRGNCSSHNCINLRLPTRGGLYAWEFEKGKRKLNVRVDGQLTFNGTTQMLTAALAGFGLAYVPEELARPHVAKGLLKRVLEEWCPPFAGYHLYYPSGRQLSPAFAVVVEALRYRRS